MKKMMNFWNASALKALMLVLLAVSFMACEKLEDPILQDTSEQPQPTNEQIYFEVGGLKSGMAEGGIITERFTDMILTANPNGLAIEHWYWSITDGADVIAFEDQDKVVYAFKSASNAFCQIELTGVGQGISQTVICFVETCADYSMAPPIVLQSTWYIGNSLYRVQFCISKSRVRPIGGLHNFFYTGNMLNSGWAPVNLPTADTNVNLASNLNIVGPPTGEMGKYYIIRMDLPLGDYEMGTGKFNNANQAIWADFGGQPGTQWVDTVANTVLIKFKVLAGSVVPNFSATGTLPGVIGDTGSDPILRFDFQTNDFTIYFNNGSTFNANKYYQMRNADFSWATTIVQTSLGVPEFVNWGKGIIPYGSGINGNLFCLRYGNNIATPNVYNPDSYLSMFWDAYDKELSFLLQDIQIISSKSGEIKNIRLPLLLKGNSM